MTKTTFVHIWDTPNVGDRFCSPKDYFRFEGAQTQSFGEPLTPASAVIYGGGQVFGRVAASINMQAGAVEKKIVWGVGIEQSHTQTPKFKRMGRKAALIGSRNKGVSGCEWVPCVSAMAPAFDRVSEPVHDTVLFYHATKSDGLARVQGMPEMSNYGCDLETALGFIGSGATVVTNSFHGTYWALCLGRRVLCVPFSSKFAGFEEAPVMAGPQDWPEKIGLARARGGVLERARALNMRFYDRCLDIFQGS